MNRASSVILLSSGVLLLAACGGGGELTGPAPVASVAVTPAAATVVVGATVQLTATAKDAADNVLTDRTVTWTSSNAAVATVSGAGLVTGAAEGRATITATSEGQSGEAAVTVNCPAPVASVTLSPRAGSAVIGGTVQLKATVKDSAGSEFAGCTVTGSSSEP